MSLALCSCELILNILFFTPLPYALKFGQTSKQYSEISQSDFYWKSCVRQYAQIAYQIFNTLPQEVKWKQTYKIYQDLREHRFKSPPTTSIKHFSPTTIFLSNQSHLIGYDEGGFKLNDQKQRILIPQATIKNLNLSANLAHLPIEAYPQRFNARRVNQILLHTSLVALGLNDGKICVYDSNGRFKHLWQEHSGGITTLRMHEDHIYSGSRDGSIRVWSIENKQSLYQLKKHKKAVTCLEPINSNNFISGSADCTLLVWQLLSKEQPSFKIIKIHKQAIVALKVLAHFSASVDQNGSIYIHDLHTLTCIQTIKPVDEVYLYGGVRDIYWDAYKLVVLLKTGVIQIWDYNQVNCLAIIPKPANFSPRRLICQENLIKAFSSHFIAELSNL